MKAKSPAARPKRDESPAPASPVDRRRFLGQLGVGAASIAALTASRAKAAPVPPGKDVGSSAGYQSFRQARAYELRIAAADMARNRPFVAHASNGDETRYGNRIGSFSKGLPHNSLGEVDGVAYGAFLGAIASGTMAEFDRIPMGGAVKLTNPLAGLAFDLEGPDSHHLTQPPAPTIASAEGGADLGENYWMALSRDVPFVDWDTSSVIADAAADLSGFSGFQGPKAQGRITPETIFRGSTPGDLVGPYLSQFLWMDIPMGALRVDQRIWTMPTGRDFLTSYEDWLAVQNGLVVSPHPPDATARFIRNLRDLGEWVHVDALYQAYHQACLILLGARAPFSAGMPYASSATQFGFGTFGGPHILSLVTEVATRALKIVWYQKWFVHRRLRPEAFGGLVSNTRRGAAISPVSPDVLNSSALDAVWSKFGSYLLPMGAPEGCPTHPSYGAGHATVAGACVTILKAWFDGSHVLSRPVVSDATGTALVSYQGPPLTVENELDKLASNVGLGRNALGVHYRSDYWQSLLLGERLAVAILEEQRDTYRELCEFSFRGFEGQTITV
ncbi:MAG TPA: vanadium-dependent haloperoxidase [Thermoanaerobaculia bacterium]|nr:vanadium-dependent haloperoxidase [Thermoanaerobaculia bacterium]